MYKSGGPGIGSMRKVIGAIGMTVALTTAFVFPATLTIIQYIHEARELSFKARLNSERLAKYIYSQDRLWHYQRIRLSELILLPDEGNMSVRQLIFTSDGQLVLEDRPSLEGPILRRRAPILVMGQEVGSIELQAPLSAFCMQVGIITFLSLIVSALAYFGLKVLPLRLLDGTVGELEQQKFRFETAVNNMIHGLTMFDGEQRLVICNQRYRDLYGIPETVARRGATLDEILTFRAQNEVPPGENAQEYKQKLATFSLDEQSRTAIFHLRNGRTISLKRNVMPGGGWVGMHEDITEQRKAAARIAHLAQHDALTDLPNRVMLRDRLNEALQHIRHGESIAVMCLDLDRFKEINDTLGHPVGDELLKQVADRLRSCTRSTDTVARMGGDEFTIVQRGAVQPESANVLAARIIDSLSEPYHIEGQQLRIGTSIGVALAPHDSTETDNLLRAADMALYRSKADGRGVCRFFKSEMNEQLQARRRMEDDLRLALAHGEFEMHYQPLLNLQTGEVDTVEGLLRWNHPERGRVSPADFIPIAEDTGAIIPIGEWALRRACHDAAGLPRPCTVAVNLSPVQFKTKNLAAMVMQALSASGLKPSRLELEITESVLIEDSESALVTLHQLRALGVRIAMDDFGTGYSSLSYLQRFPFDKIKVDKSFVQNLGRSPSAAAVLRAVGMLGAILNVTTTAEGVETEEQLLAVRAEGIAQIQGYLLSPPRPIDELKVLLQQGFPAFAPGKSAACA